MKYKLLCTDVDGTLIDGQGEITESNRRAIGQLTERKIDFAVTTGRMLRAVRLMADSYGLAPYIVCSNGAVTADPEGNILQSSYLNEVVIRRLCDMGKRYRCIMGFNTLDGVFYNQKGHFEDTLYLNANRLYGNGEEIKVRYTRGYEPPDSGEPIAKISFWACGQSEFEQLDAQVRAMPDVCVTTAMKWNLEVTAAGISKWSGIQVLMERMNLNADHVICIGDSMNDEEMIIRAGMGVCMANGQEDLKRVADYITDTNERGGVAKVIQKCLAGLL